MATVNFSGIGSSIDFGKITDAIVAQNRGSVSLLQVKRGEINARVGKLKELNAKLIAFSSAADALTERTLGTNLIASSSDAATATATAANTAAAGTINVGVTRLASSLAQASRNYDTPLDPVVVGGATAVTFELRKGGASAGATVTIDASNNSLTGLRDAINAAGAGVTASIVDLAGDGTQNQLVLNSTGTGAAGRVELVETSATGTGTDLNLRSLNPPGATTDFSALDAALSVNGLPVTRSTNTVSDAVAGVTLSLKKTGAAAVTVSQNTDAIADKLTNFVEAYNAVQDFIAAQYQPDSNGRPSGVLVGDPTLRSAQRQLRDAVGAVSTNNGGELNNLTELGLGRDDRGKLTLDYATLKSRLDSSSEDVRALLYGKTATDKGIAHSIYGVANSLSDGVSGTVQSAITNYGSSIASLDKSISRGEDRLDALRASLTRQFAAADAAINQLNNQGTAITNLIAAMTKSSRD